jgi:hypothetical protein
MKSGPARQVDPELEPGWVEEKTEEEKTRCDPADPATRSRPGCKPVDFFFIKRRCFDLKKTLTR